MKKDKPKEEFKLEKNKSFSVAVKHAIDGVIHAFKTERNLRYDYLIGASVLILSLFFDFSKTELICLVLTIGFVIFSEMINSTVEYVVDLITTEYKESAKYAKDIAAGGVLISSGIAVVVAYLLFVDKISQASTALLEVVIGSRTHLLVTILFLIVMLTIIIKGIIGKSEGEYANAFPSTRVAVSFALATYLYVVTKSLLVGGVTFALALMVASIKKGSDKVSLWHIIFSALIGILIVLAVYQLVLAKPWLSSLL